MVQRLKMLVIKPGNLEQSLGPRLWQESGPLKVNSDHHACAMVHVRSLIHTHTDEMNEFRHF